MLRIALYLLFGLILGFFESKIVDRITSKLCDKSFRGIDRLIVGTTGICFAAAYIKIGVKAEFISVLFISFLLIIIAFVDLRSRIIPDFMVLIVFAAGIMTTVILKKNFLDSLLGMVAGGGLLLLLALIPGAMGGGDVKLMFALGSILGLTRTLYAVMIAFIAAAAISLIFLLFKVVDRKETIPFGPFLTLGAFVALLFI